MIKNDLWDITNRPATKTKLEILQNYFNVWLTIWNKQNWIYNEWYIMDLFAGHGKCLDNNQEVNGSPLIFLEVLFNRFEELKNKNRKITLFLVEKDRATYKDLEKNVTKFFKNNPDLKQIVKINYFNEDCNNAIDKIIKKIDNSDKSPLFILIDPTGLQIEKLTLEKIIRLNNPKDILLNYILEGVRRTSGLLKKKLRVKNLSGGEQKTIETLKRFIGGDVNVIESSDREVLEDYVRIFTSQELKVVGYDMPYPDRNDILYYLLFASKKMSITNIVKDIFGKQKEKTLGPTLFGGKEYYKNEIFTAVSKFKKIERKSLLYKTKVEYGDWTINHIIGCMHGCKFPCYAMMMARKFGWVKNYNDWRIPRIAQNAMELLEKEIPKYKNKIDFVHLCFMTDPFMYDFERSELVPEVKELTLKIIERLNKERIKVTTLTKGIYPDDILESKYLKENEYGITLVSLNDDFKKIYEPFSVPYDIRIKSLKKLAENGLNTWASMEPYPTPELDKTAEKIDTILERISFVKKIVFGKLNYRRMSTVNNNYNKSWKNNEDFYKEMADKIIDFCQKNNIKYHIKFGTPLSKPNTTNIFKD